MDRYMNDTHSLYYNVDQSSMFGSNLSTVFADSPPPLDDGEDDHREFVFSSETDAVGEAVLNKIDAKCQRDAEAKLACDASNSRLEIKPNSSTEKFEAFANFETPNQIDASGKNGERVTVNLEENEYKGNLTNNVSGDFSDDNFRDFLTGYGQGFNENGNSPVEIPSSDFGTFSQFNDTNKLNVKSMFASNEQVGSHLGDNQFGNSEQTNGGLKSNGNSFKQPAANKFSMEKIPCQTENNHTSDDEFLSFTEGHKSDFAAFQADVLSDGGNQIHLGVLPVNDVNELTSGKLLPDMMSYGQRKFKGFKFDNEKSKLTSTTFPHEIDEDKMKRDNIKLNSFESSTHDVTFDVGKELASTNSPTELIDDSVRNTNDLILNESFTNKKESKVLTTVVSQCNTNLELKADQEIENMPDNDFGDFVDFSNVSIDAFSLGFEKSSEKEGNTTVTSPGLYSQENERISYHTGESDFGAFTESISKETKGLSRNDSNCLKQDSKKFSESVASKNGPAFLANFGVFVGSTNAMNKQPDFCAFSERTNSLNKQSDFAAFQESTDSESKSDSHTSFGAFSQNALLQKASSNKQQAMQTRLVSLYSCFQDVFITLESALDDLEHVKASGMKRLDQSNLWNSLYSNMGEAAIRFDWEQCKTSEKICTALEVSWKNIVANPNVLAMNEGLDVPVFATGLGILQPSIVPTRPKKRKTKDKQKQVVGTEQEGSSISLPVLSLPRQTVLSDFKAENVKDNNSDIASLSNSDTASLDLDFFSSAPSTLPTNLGDQNLSNSLYNLDFVLSPAVTNIQAEMNVFKASKSLQDDPMEILKKLDNSKIGNESRTRLSPRAKQIVETFEDLSFMHSSVLMFPLHKDN